MTCLLPRPRNTSTAVSWTTQRSRPSQFSITRPRLSWGTPAVVFLPVGPLLPAWLVQAVQEDQHPSCPSPPLTWGPVGATPLEGAGRQVAAPGGTWGWAISAQLPNSNPSCPTTFWEKATTKRNPPALIRRDQVRNIYNILHTLYKNTKVYVTTILIKVTNYFLYIVCLKTRERESIAKKKKRKWSPLFPSIFSFVKQIQFFFFTIINLLNTYT